MPLPPSHLLSTLWGGRLGSSTPATSITQVPQVKLGKEINCREADKKKFTLSRFFSGNTDPESGVSIL